MPAYSRQRMWTILLVAAGVAWLWHQEAGRRQLAAEVDGLKSRLVAPDHSGRRPQDGRPEPRTGLEGEPVDWVALAAKLKTNGYLMGGVLNKNAHLLAALETESVDELIAMLDHIAADDLSKKDRDVLERALAPLLAEKAPDVAFSRFSVIGKSDWSFFLGDLYRDWVKQDSEAAVAWLQRHVASGGYFYERMISTPFFDLLTSEPEASAGLLAIVPSQGRLESLRSLEVGVLKNSGQKEWANIVRNTIPEADRAEAISWPLSNWSDGDGAPMRLDQVDAYLELIGASQGERDACVMTVAGAHRSWVTTEQLKQGVDDDGPEGLDRLREWVSGHAPGMLEAATICALEEMAREGDLSTASERALEFQKASERALEFQKASGNDAYLCRVLDQANDLTNAANVSVMIEQLSDPALQAEYREKHSEILKKE